MSHTELEQYNAGDRDAFEYQFKLILYTVAIYACLIAYAQAWISLGVMAVIVSICVTRWLIAFHELFHLRGADDVDFITRLQPIPYGPFALGYREYQEIHRGHHRHTATMEDPDAFHIRGGFFRALLGSVTLQEQAFLRYVAKHGVSRELFLMTTLRLLLFVSLLWIAPTAFFAWWVVLRVTYMINDFVFFHVVHYRRGKTGTFPLPLPSWLMYPFIVIYGFDVVYATMFHDTHHRHAHVAARHLPTVAAMEA